MRKTNLTINNTTVLYTNRPRMEVFDDEGAKNINDSETMDITVEPFDKGHVMNLLISLFRHRPKLRDLMWARWYSIPSKSNRESAIQH